MGERTVLTGYGKGFLLSDILEVTKDYLLKGVEPVKAERAITQKTEKVNANIFTMIETVFNLMDLLMTWIAWYERQTAFSLMIAVVLLLWSFVVFGVGMTFAEEKTNVRAKAYFFMINIWILLFIPYSIVYNYLMAGKISAPYPSLVMPYQSIFIFVVCYIGSCVLVDFFFFRWMKRNSDNRYKC